MTEAGNDIVREVWRKLIHLGSLWVLVVIYYLDRGWAIAFFAALLCLLFAFEVGRRRSRRVEQVTTRYLGNILRSHERSRFTGAFYVVAACWLASVFFSNSIALVAVATMLISDSAAAIVGKKFGNIRLLDKSLEGSLAFFVTSFLILVAANYTDTLMISVVYMALVSFAVTIVELISRKLRVDDNLSIVLSTGFLLTLVSGQSFF